MCLHLTQEVSDNTCFDTMPLFFLMSKTFNSLMLRIIDPPSQPAAPVITDKSTSSVSLSWTPPEKDGGSPVKGYIVEVQDEGSHEWRRINTPDKLILTNAYTVSGLKENKKCRFRIVAVNAAGESEPSPRTSDVIVQDILGTYLQYGTCCDDI